MKGWKTLLFNGGIGVAALLGEVLAHLNGTDLTKILPEASVPAAVTLVGLANIVLRHVTTGPAGWKE